MTQTQSNEERENIGPLEAYRIFAEGERESNRLLTERTVIYLTASSILFLAFVMLYQPSVGLSLELTKWFRIILASLGIFLTFLLRTLNQATQNALDFLKHIMEQIEKGPEFEYMRKKGILPHKDGWEFINGEKQWKAKECKAPSFEKEKGGCRRKIPLFKNASSVCLPLAFGILWVASLVFAIKSC